jgi:hypothetical protein
MTSTQPRKRTVSEIEAALKPMESKIEELKVKKEEKLDEWAVELDILEKRTKEEFVTVYLDGERKQQPIKLKACLSDAESRKVGRILKAKDKLDLDKDEDIEKANRYSAELIEIITANPNITKEWLLDPANASKFSQTDLLVLCLSFFKATQDRAVEVAKVQSFR